MSDMYDIWIYLLQDCGGNVKFLATVKIGNFIFCPDSVSLCNCFNFNVVYRVVKLSSPNLNILIIAGAILLYVSVFLYVFSVEDKEEALTQTILCNVRW